MNTNPILDEDDVKAINDINEIADELITDCLLETHSIDRQKIATTLTQYQNMILNIKERIELKS